MTTIAHLDDQIAALQAQRALQQRQAAAQQQLSGETEAEKDEGLIRIVGGAMEQRLADKRSAGRAGWHGTDCTDAALEQLLAENLAARDWLDVAILAAMLHARQLTQAPASQQE